MCTRGGEFVAADESTIVAKPLLDPIVVENGQGDRCLPDSASTNECNWNKVFSEIDYLLDQLVASEQDPWRKRRGFSWYAGIERQVVGLSGVQIADLVRACPTVSGQSAVKSMSVTYRQTLTIASFLTFLNSTMVVGDHDLGACGVALERGNDGADALTNLRIRSMRASRRGRR
jgi:hypothetical protein